MRIRAEKVDVLYLAVGKKNPFGVRFLDGGILLRTNRSTEICFTGATPAVPCAFLSSLFG